MHPQTDSYGSHSNLFNSFLQASHSLKSIEQREYDSYQFFDKHDYQSEVQAKKQQRNLNSVLDTLKEQRLKLHQDEQKRIAEESKARRNKRRASFGSIKSVSNAQN